MSGGGFLDGDLSISFVGFMGLSRVEVEGLAVRSLGCRVSILS